MSFTTNFLDAVFGKPYHLTAKLSGHGAPINALAFNMKGTILASGGDDKQVRLWDLSTNANIQTLFETQDRWGQITRLEFTENGATDWLWIGTGRGRIAIFRRSQTSPSFVEVVDRQVFGLGDSVEHFSVDSNSLRLAATSHFGQVVLFHLQGAKLEKAWDETIDNAVPRAILFTEGGRAVTTYEMETGNVVTRDADTSLLTHSKTLPVVIGSVAVCPSKKFILMDNMADGFDLYTTATRNGLIRTFPVKSTKGFVRNGAFAEDGDVVVCGSLLGKVYIFDFESTVPVQVLHHGGGSGMVQTLATSSNPKESWIATGVSNGQFDIRIWRKQMQTPAQDLIPKDVGVSGLQLLVNIVLVLLVATLTSDKWLPSTSRIASFTAQVTSNTRGIVRVFPEFLPQPERSHEPSVKDVVDALDDDTLRRLLGLETRVGYGAIDFPSTWKVSDEELERRHESAQKFAESYVPWSDKKSGKNSAVVSEKVDDAEVDEMVLRVVGDNLGAESMHDRAKAIDDSIEAQVEEFLKAE